jgi:hypothetical protein
MAQFSHNLIQAVREMVERHWDPVEIASKMHVDVEVIRQIIDLLT